MKILIVTRNLVAYGGIPYSLMSLAKGKTGAGDKDNEIEYLVLESNKIDGVLRSKIEKTRVKVISKKTYIGSIAFLLLNKKEYDFIITTCFRTFYLSKIFTLKSKKIILWLRGANIIVKPFKRAVFKSLNSNIVIANSRYTGLANGLLEDEFVVSYNGVSSEFLKEDTSDFWGKFNIPKNAYVICYIGGWSEIKNHITLIKAFNVFAREHRNAYLLLIGEFTEITEEVKKQVLPEVWDRVRFIDKLTGASKYLRNIDLYVHPCYAEGFGNSVVESVIAGKDVLGANAGALPEILDKSRLFEISNSEELLVKMEGISNMKNIKANLMPLSEYSEKQFYIRFIEIFKRLL